MADKRLIYNDNGPNAEISNSGSNKAVYFDDTNNTLVAQGLVLNQITSSIGAVSGILSTDSTGKLTSLSTSSVTNEQYLQSNGTNWDFRTASGSVNGSYAAGSDLSGTLAAPTVIGISNIVSGTLSAQYGGTGVTSFTSGGILIKDDSSTIKFTKPDSAGGVLRPNGSGSWVSGGSSGAGAYTVQTAYFSSPGMWTKPVGIKNLKIVLQGGGGGGGGGCVLGPTNTNTGGGGAAGGLSLYEFNNLDSNQSFDISINVGTGGTGGSSNSSPTGVAQNGTAGGTSYASSSLLYCYAGGGGGGRGGDNAANAGSGGTSGWGNLTKGIVGNGQVRNSAAYKPSGVGSGGGGAGISAGTTFPSADGGDYLLLNSSVAARGAFGANNGTPTAQPGSPGGSTAIALSVPPYTLYVGGGGGGGAKSPAPTFSGSSGGNGVYGSGGGGASSISPSAPTTNAKGGDGGNGYVLIAYW